GSVDRLRVAAVGINVLPFAGIRAGHHGDDRLALAEVEDLVGYARLDVEEVARLVLDRLPQAGSVLVPDSALEDVEHQLKTDVDVGVSDAARGNCRHIHRELR